MLQNGLQFTMVTGDPGHRDDVAKAITLLPIHTKIEQFDACEDLMPYLEKSRYEAYQVILLDLEKPVDVGMECVRAIRANVNFNDLVLIGYGRQDKSKAIQDFFAEGGNIYFTYPKTPTMFTKTFEKLVRLNWQIYTTGTKMENLVVKLSV